MQNKKLFTIIAIVVGVIILLVVGVSIFFWAIGPKHFIAQYFKQINNDKDFVLENTYQEFILEDYDDYYKDIEKEWRKADKLTYRIEKDEAWRQETSITTDEEGDEIEELTKFKPYYQWLSSNYRAWVIVETDGDLETYVLEFKRKSDNEWNVFSYWTKPWVMYDIWYEDEYQDYISFDDEDWDGEDFFEFDTEDIEDEEIEEGEEGIVEGEEAEVIEVEAGEGEGEGEEEATETTEETTVE